MEQQFWGKFFKNNYVLRFVYLKIVSLDFWWLNIYSFAKLSEMMEIIKYLLLLSRFSHVWLCATPQTAGHQAPPSLDSPGKNTGVGCHFLLQCMHACMLSRFSHVRICATLWTAAHQAPPSIGFSRQEYWSEVPFPSSQQSRNGNNYTANMYHYVSGIAFSHLLFRVLLTALCHIIL